MDPNNETNNNEVNPNPQAGGSGEIPTPTPAPSMPDMGTPTPPTPEENKGDKSVGPIVGSIIVIIIVILGGLYFWGARLVNEETAEEITQNDAVSQTLAEQNVSDEVNAIEEDLNATDFSDIDADLDRIDSELNI